MLLVDGGRFIMMSDTDDPRSGLSVASERDIAGEGVNQNCHTYTGGVKANQKHVMRAPRVVIIFWGHYYTTNSDVVSAGVKLISDLVTGPFKNGLVQYGVGQGSVAGHIVIDTNQNSPAPMTLDENQAQTQIISWIKPSTGTPIVTPAPSVDETNLLYFLFSPTTTQLTLTDGTTGFCGYHKHTKVNPTSQNDDLFWGIVDTTKAAQLTGTEFANKIAFCASHELAEAMSDRDGQGFISDTNCEIGDICELNTDHPWFQYRGWTVEQYWSNWDNTCIHGDQPVSMRKFLASIGFDVRQGLRSLNTPVINLQYMASRE